MKYFLFLPLLLYSLIFHTLLFIFERVVWFLGLFLIPIGLAFSYIDQTKLTSEGFQLYRLPSWLNRAYGNDKDGFGDTNYAVNTCKYPSLTEYNTKAWYKHWVWLAWRNPCHNFCITIPIYHIDFSKVKSISYIGNAIVDNRVIDSKGQAGFQFVWATGGWRLYTGIYFVIRYGSSMKCFRFRVGYKIQPKDVEKLGSSERALWTFSFFSPFKSMINGF